MDQLSKDMAAYDRMRDELERDYFGKWVIVRDEELVGTYDESEDAVNDAIRRFGRGPYHIRQVGPQPIISIFSRPVYDFHAFQVPR